MASAKAKDYDTAIDILRAYAVRLDGSNLHGERVAMLRRPVEQRIDNYRKLKSQDEWDSKIDAQRFPMKGNEQQRTAEVRKRQGDLEGMMHQANGLVRDGKYEEALVLAYKMKDLDPDSPVPTMLIETTKIRR